MKELIKKLFREKLPHEIIPNLQYWEEGDKISGWVKGTYVLGYYMGCFEGKLHVYTEDFIFSFYPERSMERFNNSFNKRKVERDRKTLRSSINQDHYNEFLKLLKENERQLLEEWSPKFINADNIKF